MAASYSHSLRHRRLSGMAVLLHSNQPGSLERQKDQIGTQEKPEETEKGNDFDRLSQN